MWNSIKYILFGAIVVSIMILFLHITAKNYLETRNNSIQEAIENNYTFYLDGNEINVENIDINQYQITIDNEKEKVFLTHKDTSYYPIPNNNTYIIYH